MKNTETTQTEINTYLPLFPGFYSTLFEPDFEYFESENDYLETELFIDPKKVDLSDRFNNSAYEKAVAIQACNFIERELSEFTEKIEFVQIISPREYNFTNDSIEVKITPNIEAIKEYIYDNLEAYKTYLENNFKSRSGFMSFVNYDFESWKEYTNNFTDYSGKYPYLGSILQFICENEEITDENMYYYCSDYVYLTEYLGYDKLELIEDVLLTDAIVEVMEHVKDNYTNVSKIEQIESEFEEYINAGLLVNDIVKATIKQIESKNLTLNI